MADALRIAVVRSRDGYTTVCGPNDFSKDYDDPMNAALGWHLEAGHIPADVFWATINLPPIPDIPELAAQAERGEYPKSWIEEA